MVPFRYLLLAAGLFEFGRGFLARRGQGHTGAEKAVPADAPAPAPGAFLGDNLLALAPSDEALRLAYAHEAKFVAAANEQVACSAASSAEAG